MTTQDKRYHIGLEFCGHDVQKYVLRWCGDYLGAFDSQEQAEASAVAHAIERGHNATGWFILASEDSAVWLFTKRNGRRRYRVCYGADIKETDDFEKAANHYAYALRHQLECNGVTLP